MENEALKDVILQLAALSGEISEHAVMLLPSTEKYLTNLLLEMRRDGLLKRSDKDDVIGYRLSQVGKQYLRDTYPKRYSDYFGHGGITDKVRLDGIHRQRYQRMSEINAMMYNLGTSLFPGTKTCFHAPLAVESQTPHLSQSSQARYDTSFELKALGEEAIKINPSRAMGLLACQSGSYLVYHTHTGPIKWEDMTEYRMRMLFGQKRNTEIHSIMIGADLHCALALLQSDGGRRNRYYQVSPEYQKDMFYVPMNRYGLFQMQYAFLTNAHQRLKQRVLSAFRQEIGIGSLVCDGYADERTGILFACDFDLCRLVLFKNGIEVRKMKGIVYCFDFQAEVLGQYFGETVKLRVLDFGEVEKVLNR